MKGKHWHCQQSESEKIGAVGIEKRNSHGNLDASDLADGKAAPTFISDTHLTRRTII